MGDHPAKTASAVDYNYAETTAEEGSVAGAARPGARKQRCFSDAVASPTTAAEVAEWVAFMQGEGVGAVVSLLSPEEAATYEPPGVEAAMRAAFGADGYSRFNAKDAGAASPAAILDAIDALLASKKKVVVHCWGGGGRTGLVQAAWLARSRGLPAADAAAAVVQHAKAAGVPRRVDLRALEAFLAEAATNHKA